MEKRKDAHGRNYLLALNMLGASDAALLRQDSAATKRAADPRVNAAQEFHPLLRFSAAICANPNLNASGRRALRRWPLANAISAKSGISSFVPIT